MRRGGLSQPLSLSAVLLSLLLPQAGLPAQEAANEKELARIIKAIDTVKGEIAGLRRERGDVQKDLESAERRISDVRGELQTTQEDMALAEIRLTTLREEADQLDAQREEQQGVVAAYLRQAARQGGQSSLQLLLSQEQPQEAARLMRYNGYLTSARAELIQTYAANLAKLDEVRSSIDEELFALETRQEALATQEDELAGAQAERETALASLDTKLTSGGAELERLETQRVEIEVLMEELRRSITDLPLDGSDEPITAAKGKLPWPLDGKLTRRFGSRHELGDLTYEGLTISAPAGTEVHAVHHGRVVFADWFGSSGLLLILDHGDGYMSLYAHNQELYAAVGEWVGSGAVISAAGNTGGQSDSGLYFEIRHNGRAEDPARWLRSRN
jgi:septal ring factor EnvC (AmiA/AmiB activator)